MSAKKNPAWVYQGKSVWQLIEELGTFENQDREVFISIDCGDSRKSAGSINKKNGYYLLSNRKEDMKIELAEPGWSTHGKSIRELITELRSLENQNFEIRISIDCDGNSKPISLIGKKDIYCIVSSCSDFYDRKTNLQ